MNSRYALFDQADSQNWRRIGNRQSLTKLSWKVLKINLDVLVILVVTVQNEHWP